VLVTTTVNAITVAKKAIGIGVIVRAARRSHLVVAGVGGIRRRRISLRARGTTKVRVLVIMKVANEGPVGIRLGRSIERKGKGKVTAGLMIPKARIANENGLSASYAARSMNRIQDPFPISFG
jgi:hypothetical protein